MLQSTTARLKEVVEVGCTEGKCVGIVACNCALLGAGGLLPREPSPLSKALNMFVDSP